ncbi:uncharacterized protein AMSG_08426 [Thecamonas trahens ATCC 50062]|uniref:Uncharacterized protein n=1 Tax=Thecamonas trahens ATCC 50062 TaxID=461836 RepID=A0A0L0DJ63_THETB|nr:hypothetical protein AMSG_08426 [Thecamonas trahens ATCC 50062]KNC52444.1 hypothetical protein AMSG_08426 [Thecamonas trahens ATCC 50062]|eukprot:XP_013755484.1 hypothetical protein AMSG_08426 [Thecamonas trahens ATCC 50062]
MSSGSRDRAGRDTSSAAARPVADQALAEVADALGDEAGRASELAGHPLMELLVELMELIQTAPWTESPSEGPLAAGVAVAAFLARRGVRQLDELLPGTFGDDMMWRLVAMRRVQAAELEKLHRIVMSVTSTFEAEAMAATGESSPGLLSMAARMQAVQKALKRKHSAADAALKAELDQLGQCRSKRQRLLGRGERARGDKDDRDAYAAAQAVLKAWLFEHAHHPSTTSSSTPGGGSCPR